MALTGTAEALSMSVICIIKHRAHSCSAAFSNGCVACISSASSCEAQLAAFDVGKYRDSGANTVGRRGGNVPASPWCCLAATAFARTACQSMLLFTCHILSSAALVEMHCTLQTLDVRLQSAPISTEITHTCVAAASALLFCTSCNLEQHVLNPEAEQGSALKGIYL